MTGTIIIDESGDLGSSGTRYFSMAAIVAFRSRDLKRAANVLPNQSERKWYNSSKTERETILEEMSKCRFRTVYTVIDKNNPLSHKCLYGNDLYKVILRQVVSDSMEILPCKDVNVLLDRNSFITVSDFRDMVREESINHRLNPLKIDMISSDQNKCIQLVDFIAGASRAKYEIGDQSIELISEKISIARRH